MLAQTPATFRSGAFQFGLRGLLVVPVVAALCCAAADWWGAAGVSASVIVIIAAVSLRLRRLVPLILLGCYIASYAILIRHDPAGRAYAGSYEQIASGYLVCDRHCQVLYRPLELIDRELRRTYWRFACVW